MRLQITVYTFVHLHLIKLRNILVYVIDWLNTMRSQTNNISYELIC